MTDLPKVSLHYHGHEKEPIGLISLEWLANKQSWQVIDWLTTQGKRSTYEGDNPRNGVLKFQELVDGFLLKWQLHYQGEIDKESTFLKFKGPDFKFAEKGFRPQTAKKRWWLYKTSQQHMSVKLGQQLEYAIIQLQKWLTGTSLSVPELKYPDPFH